MEPTDPPNGPPGRTLVEEDSAVQVERIRATMARMDAAYSLTGALTSLLVSLKTYIATMTLRAKDGAGHETMHKTQYPDSIELGTPAKGGALKFYFDASKPDEAESRAYEAERLLRLSRELHEQPTLAGLKPAGAKAAKEGDADGGEAAPGQ